MYDAQVNSQYERRWKGIFRLREPDESRKGSDQYNWQMRDISNFIGCIEESNAGYHWDWNEASLKGKLIGIRVREYEWETDNGAGISTEVGNFCTVEDARSGKLKNMPMRKLKNRSQATAPVQASSGFTPVDVTDEIPF